MTDKGFFDRIREEFSHWRRRTWSFRDVGDHWDRTEDYDAINEETYSYFRRFTDGYRLSDLKDQGTALDFCARTGNGSAFFYSKGKIGTSYCADVSLRMGEICRQRLNEAGLERHLWLPVLQYDLPFADESFDSILCFETVEHFPEPGRLIDELGRVARPGAQLVLTTPNVLWEPVHALAAVLRLHHSEGPHRFVRLSSLRRMIRRAGFAIEREETTVLIPGGPKALVRLGDWVENHTRRSLMPVFGLRRILVGTRR
jgi:SAM-dependent methyltransferase